MSLWQDGIGASNRMSEEGPTKEPCLSSQRRLLGSILNAYFPLAGWNRHIKQDVGGGTKEGAMFIQSDGDDSWWNRCIKQDARKGTKKRAMFVQSDRHDSWKKNITCHRCNKKGHLLQECPEKSKAEKEQMHVNV
jgi:hypothetical protein